MAKPRTAGKLTLCFVLLLSALVRLPSVQWDAISDDEGIYDAMGVVINQGGLMYRDAVDHKPPGLAYTYAWVARLCGAHASGAERIAAVHLFGALVAVGTALGLYLLGKRMLPRRAQLWPPMLFALSSTAKVPFDGLAVNGELLMGFPSIWALVLVEWGTRARRHERALCDIAAGALLAMAILYKWQAGLLALPMAWMGLLSRERHPTVGWLLRVLSWGLGVATVLGLVAYRFYLRDGLNDAIEWGFLFNRHYLAAGTQGLFWWRRLLQGLVGAVLPSWPLYVFGVLTAMRWLRHPRALTVEAAVGLWAMLSVAAVALGGRFFGHYFLQAELPLCLLAAAPLCARYHLRRRPRWLVASLIVPWACFFALSAQPQRALALLNREDPDWRALGQSIAAHASPGDTLFVWGNAPLLYHFSNLPMGTRFSFCNYLTGVSPATPSEREHVTSSRPSPGTAHARAQLLEDIAHKRPTFVFDSAAGGIKGYAHHPIHAHAGLSDELTCHYTQIATSPLGILYRRASMIPLAPISWQQ